MDNLFNILSGFYYSLSGLINPIEKSYNYNENINKPSINNIILSGDLTSEDLGLITTQNFLSASLPNIEFDPTQVFILNTNSYNRNLASQPAAFIYDSNGVDVTALTMVQWDNGVLIVDATQIDQFNVPLTGIWKIKFAGVILYNRSQQDLPRTLTILHSTTFTPQTNKVYRYDIIGNETFVFNSPSNLNELINFRLYLITPSTLVSFTLPTNIIWENIPDISNTNSLYMFCFEWNPILNKWLGNSMWNPITLEESSISE